MEHEPAPPPDIKMSKSQRTINKVGKKLSNKNTTKNSIQLKKLLRIVIQLIGIRNFRCKVMLKHVSTDFAQKNFQSCSFFVELSKAWNVLGQTLISFTTYMQYHCSGCTFRSLISQDIKKVERRNVHFVCDHNLFGKYEN